MARKKHHKKKHGSLHHMGVYDGSHAHHKHGKEHAHHAALHGHFHEGTPLGVVAREFGHDGHTFHADHQHMGTMGPAEHGQFIERE